MIIASDELGATGGPNANEVFLLAVTRASEICIGIVSAGIVLAGTDFGGARRRLAALFAALSAEIAGRFTGMLALAGPDLPETLPATARPARARSAGHRARPYHRCGERGVLSNPLSFAGGADGRGRLVRSGRIEARTGLRMMPTFPRSPLTFRTAGFPRYG